MRKITINLAAVAAFCIVVASPALVSSSCATPKTEQEDTTIIREDSGITALKYSSPEVPASIEFCGKTIDLSPLTATSVWTVNYWHSPICTVLPCKC